MLIEVLICTHNRVALLERTIESIDKATCCPDVNVEILVVANACTDGTRDMLKAYTSGERTLSWQLRFIEEPTPGKSYALNTGIASLHGDIIALIDDDQRVTKNYFTSIVEACRLFPDVSIYCGCMIPDWTGLEPGWIHDLGDYAIYPRPFPEYDFGNEFLYIDETKRLPSGGNLIVRRQVFARVGLFAAELGPQGHNLGGGEDADFIHRALAIGEQIIYSPKILQYHVAEDERLTLRYLMEKSFQRSYSATRVTVSGHRGIPRYLWRKLASYGFRVLASLYWPEKRFYLIRIAATLGEIRAYAK